LLEKKFGQVSVVFVAFEVLFKKRRKENGEMNVRESEKMVYGE
jgi:hypothetical protein